MVPSFRAERELECSGNVPGDEGDDSGNPADERFGEKGGDSLNWTRTQKSAERDTNEPLWQAVKERNGWRAVSLTVACAAIVLVPLVALFMRDRPADLVPIARALLVRAVGARMFRRL